MDTRLRNNMYQNMYTVDNDILNEINKGNGSGTGDLSDYEKTADVDKKLAKKADIEDVFSKDEANGKFSHRDTTYTKVETDTVFATKEELFSWAQAHYPAGSPNEENAKQLDTLTHKGRYSLGFNERGIPYVDDYAYLLVTEHIQTGGIRQEFSYIGDNHTPEVGSFYHCFRVKHKNKGWSQWSYIVDDYKILENVYRKSEADAKFALKGEGGTPVDAYTKTESDGKYQTKGNYALKGDSYTKTEADNKYPTKTASYTKSESDTKYALKGDIPAPVDAYTKVESDVKYALKEDIKDTNYTLLLDDEGKEVHWKGADIIWKRKLSGNFFGGTYKGSGMGDGRIVYFYESHIDKDNLELSVITMRAFDQNSNMNCYRIDYTPSNGLNWLIESRINNEEVTSNLFNSVNDDLKDFKDLVYTKVASDMRYYDKNTVDSNISKAIEPVTTALNGKQDKVPTINFEVEFARPDQFIAEKKATDYPNEATRRGNFVSLAWATKLANQRVNFASNYIDPASIIFKIPPEHSPTLRRSCNIGFIQFRNNRYEYVNMVGIINPDGTIRVFQAAGAGSSFEPNAIVHVTAEYDIFYNEKGDRPPDPVQDITVPPADTFDSSKYYDKDFIDSELAKRLSIQEFTEELKKYHDKDFIDSELAKRLSRQEFTEELKKYYDKNWLDTEMQKITVSLENAKTTIQELTNRIVELERNP